MMFLVLVNHSLFPAPSARKFSAARYAPLTRSRFRAEKQAWILAVLAS